MHPRNYRRCWIRRFDLFALLAGRRCVLPNLRFAVINFKLVLSTVSVPELFTCGADINTFPQVSSHRHIAMNSLCSGMIKNYDTSLTDRSLLDIFSETSSVSKCYTLMCMIPVLDADEIRTLSETLPPELSFLNRKGLVHLLPPNIFSIFNRGTRECRHSISKRELLVRNCRNPNFDDGDLRHMDSFFSLPYHLQQAPDPTRSNLDTPYPSTEFSSSAINTTSRHRRDINEIHINGINPLLNTASTTSFDLRVIGGVLDTSSADAFQSRTLPPSIEHPPGDFESTLQNIIQKKSQCTSDWIVQQASSAIAASLSHLTSGGSMSDLFMIKVIGVTAVGAAAADFYLRGNDQSTLLHISNFSDSNRARSVHRMLELASNYTVKCALPCMIAVATTTGTMLAVRNIRRVSSATLEFRLSVSGLVICCRDYIRKTHLMSYLATDQPLLMIVISAWALTAFIALQLSLKVKNTEWIFNSIFAKMLRKYVDAFDD